jgi:hypothetical protein
MLMRMLGSNVGRIMSPFHFQRAPLAAALLVQTPWLHLHPGHLNITSGMF